MVMKRYLSLLLLTLLFTLQGLAATLPGYVIASGRQIPATYTILPDGTLGLGNGYNACISQYTNARVTVPDKIKILGKEFRVTRIMPLAFRLCDHVRVVILREGITHIDDFAFTGCGGLREVDLPSTMESIGTGVFCGLGKLLYIVSRSETPPVWEYNDVCFLHEGGISDSKIQQFPDNVSLLVPTGREAAYRQARYTNASFGWTTPEGWGTAFQSIKEGASDKFRIYDPEDLYELKCTVNNPGSYGDMSELWLETDIDMKDSLWTTCIGSDIIRPYKGTIYGQGHYIRNLTVKTNRIAGLFGHCNGAKISALRLDNCNFQAPEVSASIAAVVNESVIDSCYVKGIVATDGVGGGIIGRALGKVTIDRCVAEIMFQEQTRGSNPVIGGLVGFARELKATNCATHGNINICSNADAFVGECVEGGYANIDYCYSVEKGFSRPKSPINYGAHVILGGDPLSFVDHSGLRCDFAYGLPQFKSVFPAAVLGLESWAYCTGQYPLPDCFTDLWTTKANHAVYGSATLAAKAINVLAPDEAIPASAWLDLSDMGFRHYKFKASRLWIDDKMDVIAKEEQLPLGLSRQITVENGIILEDTLTAADKGRVPVKEPVYKTDENHNFLHDEAGNLICIDSLYLFDKTLWEETVYSLCLPYNVALSDNCTLYQPTEVYDVSGETVAHFGRVRDNYVEAFRPYLLVVHRDSVPLGTLTQVICPKLEGRTHRMGDYEYEGTVTHMANIDARGGNLYMLEDSRHWLRYKDSDDLETGVNSFSAYFRAIGDNPAKRIRMVLDDDNPVISVGDFYYVINTDDEDNVTATLTGYHGSGGNVVVPPTAPYVTYGQKTQVPLTELAPDIFARNTAQVWSIDMSQCNSLETTTIERTTKGNPFYKVDPRTIIYMPEGKAQAGPNNVIGTECQQLTITDTWDFCPPYDFHADEAIYGRTLYASKQADGSYESYAYTVCLPFTMTKQEIAEAMERQNHNAEINIMQYVSENNKSFVFTNYGGLTRDQISAGYPYLIKIKSGELQIKAHDTKVLASPASDEDCLAPLNYDNSLNGSSMGHWKGTFRRISNEDAANMNAYVLNGGTGLWYRIRSEDGRYRTAWVGAFRAYFKPSNPLTRNTYQSDYTLEPQGEDDITYHAFDAKHFDVDADFSGYDYDDETLIRTPEAFTPTDSEGWYGIDGRKLSGMPKEKGIYIYKGRKVYVY